MYVSANDEEEPDMTTNVNKISSREAAQRDTAAFLKIMNAHPDLRASLRRIWSMRVA